MKKENVYDVFLVLGAVWLIVGLLIYRNPAVWPLGFIFLIIGFIGKFGRKKSKDEQGKE
ncbi:MAG: hypothetical protein GXO70_01000 [Acidobacteria bacterium]|nr:hypothetical protein [Acidobacteriota bacterium]